MEKEKEKQELPKVFKLKINNETDGWREKHERQEGTKLPGDGGGKEGWDERMNSREERMKRRAKEEVVRGKEREEEKCNTTRRGGGDEEEEEEHKTSH